MVKITYTVQAGAYSSKANAVKQQDKLKAKGFDSILKQVDSLYKVQIGAFEIKASAEAYKASAEKAGFSCLINEVETIIPDPPVDYRKKAAAKAPVVYDAIIAAKCTHKGGATAFAEIKSKHITTCSASVSAVLQEIGLLPKGCLISHTAAIGGTNENQIKKKASLSAAMKGQGKLDMTKCKIVKCMKCWKDLPADLKKPGIVYVQDSNICMSGDVDAASRHFNFTCNAGGSQLNSKGQYINNRMTSGYTFNHPILYAVVPLIV